MKSGKQSNTKKNSTQKAQKRVKNLRDRFVVESDEKWREWSRKIPFIPPRQDWEISPVPPFGGAMARFRVKDKYSDATVSVYLDVYERLGFFGEPYWEVYPVNDDVFRCKMDDIDSLVEAIEQSLGEQEKNKLKRLVAKKLKK